MRLLILITLLGTLTACGGGLFDDAKAVEKRKCECLLISEEEEMDKAKEECPPTIGKMQKAFQEKYGKTASWTKEQHKTILQGRIEAWEECNHESSKHRIRKLQQQLTSL